MTVLLYYVFFLQSTVMQAHHFLEQCTTTDRMPVNLLPEKYSYTTTGMRPYYNLRTLLWLLFEPFDRIANHLGSWGLWTHVERGLLAEQILFYELTTRSQNTRALNKFQADVAAGIQCTQPTLRYLCVR